MTREEAIFDAVAYFDAGLNCAEAALRAAARYAGIESALVPRVATAFGAGLARRQEVCGFATGGLMALGLLFGRDGPMGDKETPYALGQEYLKLFEAEKGSLVCRQITGIDMTVPEQAATYRMSGGIHYTVCGPLLTQALNILFDIIDRQREELA